MQSQPIIIQAFNQGGLADSKWSGVANSLYKMLGLDPHSAPGILRIAQALAKITDSPDEFCKARVNSSNGRTYWGSSESGKIWEIQLDGTVTLVATIAPTTGSAAILEMKEYGGTIYIATEDYLHKIVAADALGASEWTSNLTQNWQAFLNGDADFHPMIEQNLVLYIGDGNVLAQVDAGTFSNNALDIDAPRRISALGKLSTRVLVGSFVADNVTKTAIFDWDTFSDSFITSDEIDEVGVNAFLEADNYAYCQCGLAGNIYIWDGEKLQLDKKIPGDYSPTAQAKAYYTAVAEIEGQILFGMSNVTGNPCDQGVYRIARNSRGYPYIMDLPYPISERSGGNFVLSGIEIGGILVVGSNILVSWKNGASVGIDMLDYSTKLNGAYFESRIMRPDRFVNTTFPKFEVAYNLLPTDTDISILYKKNYANSYEPTSEIVDSDRNVVKSEEGVEATTLQLKVAFTTSGNTAPEIEAVNIPQQ